MISSKDVGDKTLHLSKPSQYMQSTPPNLKSPANFQISEIGKRNDAVKKPSDFCLSKQKLVEKSSGIIPSVVTDTNDILTQEDKLVFQKNNTTVGLLSPKSLNVDISLKHNDDFRFAASQAEIKALQMKLANTEMRFVEEKEELKMNNDELNNIIMKISKEKISLQEQIDTIERNSFNEVKDVYNKYILLQKQQDDDKANLNRKIRDLKILVKNLTYERDELVKKCDSLSDENNHLCKLAKTEKDNTILMEEKMLHEVKTLQLELQGLYSEKNDLMNQIEKLTSSLKSTNQTLEGKVCEAEDLRRKLGNELDNYKRICIAHNEKVKHLEQNVRHLDEHLKKEVINSHAANSFSKEKEYQVVSLEKALTQLKTYVNDVQYNTSEKIKSFCKQVESKTYEIETLQETCKTLQSTNELLNVRLSSLNDILCLQELSLGDVVNGNKKDKLLKVWRQKVYSLLVKLKTHEIKEQSKLEVGSNWSY